MGAAIGSALSMGLSYCVCNSANSFCHAALGTTEAGTTGRRRSVLLLTIAIALSLWFKYDVSNAIVTEPGGRHHHFGGGGGWWYIPYVAKAWRAPCERYNDNNDLVVACARNAGAYRPLAIATLFFTFMAIASHARPRFNREAWPAKMMLFLFCAFATIFLPSSPFTGPYLLLARLGAAVFCLFQQIILIDIAYNWNEAWVERADAWDRYSFGGGGNVWLRVIVVTTVGLYMSVLVGIGLLYRYFSCADNMWIVTLTLLGVVAVTAVSALADGGSLLTSGVISLYVTYLAYSMVSKNPVPECNPQLGSDDVTGMVIGLTLTALSLAWTGWSFTAEETLEGTSNQRAASTTAQRDVHLETPFLDPDEARPTSGVVVDGGNDDQDDRLRNVWKLNVVMALISCWVAMTLTGWGSLEDDTHAANPTAGRFNMAMIGISQWCAILLYVWTLAAPTLFPDRDFS